MFKKLFADTLESTNESVGADEGTEITIKNAIVTITVKDEDIAKRLKFIAEKENVKLTDDASSLIARLGIRK